MTKIHRRGFLGSAGTATAGLMAADWLAPMVQAAKTADPVTIGIIGCKRGRTLAEEFANLGARIAYVCDVDDVRAADLKKRVGADNAVTDIRRVLDDPSVERIERTIGRHRPFGRWSFAPTTRARRDARRKVFNHEKGGKTEVSS